MNERTCGYSAEYETFAHQGRLAVLEPDDLALQSRGLPHGGVLADAGGRAEDLVGFHHRPVLLVARGLLAEHDVPADLVEALVVLGQGGGLARLDQRSDQR